jgi:hypothetical protein
MGDPPYAYVGKLILVATYREICDSLDEVQRCQEAAKISVGGSKQQWLSK